MLVELIAGACEPEKVARLLSVIRRRLGHRIAFAVEDGKIALSDAETTALPLGFIDNGLCGGKPRARASTTPSAPGRTALFATATACIQDAGPEEPRRHRHDLLHRWLRQSPRCPRCHHPRRAHGAGTHWLSRTSSSVALGLTREAQKRFA